MVNIYMLVLGYKYLHVLSSLSRIPTPVRIIYIYSTNVDVVADLIAPFID